MSQSQPRRAGSGRGFTLMEVMIAVAIVSIMGGLIYGSFGPFLRSKEVVEAEGEHYRVIQGALSRMSREVSMAFVSNDFDRTRYRDAHDQPTFFTGDRDKLSFTSFAHQRRVTDAKESDQAIFEYKMGRPQDEHLNNEVLMRREKAVLDEEFERGGSEDVLCDDVKKVKFQYYDDTKKEWVDEWDTRRDRKVLPERVKITLVSTDERSKEVEYTVQAKVFLRTPIAH
jgi:general secretion pathway protein J